MSRRQSSLSKGPTTTRRPTKQKRRKISASVGDTLYIPSTDNNRGGLATIAKIVPGISAGKVVDFASFSGIHMISFNVKVLLKDQRKLKKMFRRGKAVSV